MRLDVIVPTHNRRTILERALISLLDARIPAGLSVGVTVVDNDSADDTAQLVQAQQWRFGGRLAYLLEREHGKSAALNAGIHATAGELVGMIDDDEEIDRDWYRQVYDAFTTYDVDFIGGPYRPLWGAERPAWLPHDHRSALGWVDGGDCIVPFDHTYQGILMGGNAVIRRTTLERVGPYTTQLGPTPTERLMSCEDEEMYLRLLAAGAKGLYLPQLIVHHYVSPERLTRRYYRRWSFWRGVSRGVLNRLHRPPVVHMGGVPRYLYGGAARSTARLLRAALSARLDRPQTFSDELALWDLAGFLYGRHLYRRDKVGPAVVAHAD